MAETIKLTPRQIELIEEYRQGKMSMLGTPVKKMEQFMPVISMAQDLMLKTNEDVGDDLIEWFYQKYLKQQEESGKE